jgi:excisionase family DNA binding protein
MVTHLPEITGRKQPARSTRTPIDDRLVYTVPEAGRLLGLGRNAAYEAAKRGEIPTIRIGRLLLVPKVPFHRMLENVGTGTAVSADKSATPKIPVLGRQGSGGGAET